MQDEDPEMGRIEELQRQARIISLLHGAERAGIAPIGVIPFHAFAYLANTLAPVWNMPALDGKVLKRKGGPYYPSIQKDIDRLVGIGMVSVQDIGHVQDHLGKWRIEGRYALNTELSARAVTFIESQEDELRLLSFVEELALALSVLTDAELQSALVEDATYSDPAISDGNVLDFGEWDSNNYSVLAADYFDRFMPAGVNTTPGEKLHLYVSHIRERFNAA